MKLFYDARDVAYARRRQSHHIDWLRDLAAVPIQQMPDGADGFLFTGARLLEDYGRLIASHGRFLSLALRIESRHGHAH